MLRARAPKVRSDALPLPQLIAARKLTGSTQTHSSSYVCHLCRCKFSQTVAPQRWRSSPVPNALVSSCRNSPITSGAPSTRHFSTTGVLRSSNGDSGSPAKRFPGLGAASSGGFGGFGIKKATSEGKPSLSNELLPHERAARQQVATTPKPTKPSTEENDNQHTKHRFKRNGQHTSMPQSALHREQSDKSRTVLADIFNKSQNLRRQGSRTEQKSANRDGNANFSPNTQPPTQAWGAFSRKKTSTFEDAFAARRSETRSGEARLDNKPGSGNRFETLGAKMRFREDDIAQKLREKKPDQTEPGDFWGALDQRVPETSKKRAENNPDTTAKEMQPRRISRFEMGDETGRGGKRDKEQGKRKKRAGRSGRWDEVLDEDFDDARWEEIQKRKEEKKKRKLELEAEGPQAVPIFLPEFISVLPLAKALKQSPSQFVRDLEEMGFENMTNDTIMTGETASLIAMEYGFEPTVDDGTQRDLRPRPAPEEPTLLPPRPPIVTIMGHVDHGKTTLLDYLRKSSVAAQEHGGITQHIGAFVVKMSSGKPITFLDTPGHAAFLSMRQRGANVTDIVVLVVAADDSVKPQTLEALKHANNAKVPIIVAINKIDKDEARVDQVKADLARHDVQIEDFGGDVQVVEVSGKTGQGMDSLEENIVTLSEMLDTRSEQDGMAEGWVIESSIKPDGKVATVLVKRGTLRLGDVIVAGQSWARVRLLRNEAGVEVSEAPPGTPVEIFGWRELPEAGEQMLQAPDEDKAKMATDYRIEMAERLESSAYLAEQEERQREKAAVEAAAKAAAEEALEGDVSAPAEDDETPKVITQNFIVKADVVGSVEPVVSSVLEQGNNEVQSKVLRSGAGQITEYDVDLASASKSIIINFNSPVQPHIKMRANDGGVRIIDHSVIYHLVDETKDALSDLLPLKITHKVLGEADVLQIFPINLRGRVYQNIAGCRVRNGNIKKTSLVKVLRKGKVMYDGKLQTKPARPACPTQVFWG